MKLGMFGLSVAMLASFTASALAGPGAPPSPPPASGVFTPYNTEPPDREAPAFHPAASVSSVVRCAPAGTSATLVNGAMVPAAQPGTTALSPGGASATSVVLVNGASIPTASGPTDETWCGGAYREDWGTNFGSR
jgi:hypothetical protein